jgi:hypothetical protein
MAILLLLPLQRSKNAMLFLDVVEYGMERVLRQNRPMNERMKGRSIYVDGSQAQPHRNRTNDI